MQCRVDSTRRWKEKFPQLSIKARRNQLTSLNGIILLNNLWSSRLILLKNLPQYANSLSKNPRNHLGKFVVIQITSKDKIKQLEEKTNSCYFPEYYLKVTKHEERNFWKKKQVEALANEVTKDESSEKRW